MITNERLDETLATALHALKILVESKREIRLNGDLTLNLGPEENYEGIFNSEISEAKKVLSDIPEIAVLLELRILEIQKAAAYQRLQKLRGKNG